MPHPFHVLGRKQPKTAEEKMLLAAILILSTKQGFIHLSFERIYDWLLAFDFEAYNEANSVATAKDGADAA